MSDVVRDAIAAEIAQLAREVRTPIEPFAYGRDLSCTNDVTERLDEVDPTTPLAIGEALYRRITTGRGTLPGKDDPDYGLDVREFLSAPTDTRSLLAMAGQIESELRKDDRVSEVTVTVTAPDVRVLLIAIAVEPQDPNVTDFAMTVSVTDGPVLFEITQ